MLDQVIDAKIRMLIIRDLQDTSQTQTKSVSAATHGMFGGYKGKGYSRITQQHSGIHSIAGINTDGHELVAHDTYMLGGKISTEGKNHFKTDNLMAEVLGDVEHRNGFGINGNLHDGKRVLSGHPSNRAGEPIFTVANVQMDKKDFVAIQKPVIYGNQSTEFSVQSLKGEVETQHENGKVIQKDSSLHVQVDVPLTNHEFLAQVSENAHGAEVRLSTLLQSNSQPQEYTTVERPTPKVPIEENSASASLLAHRRRRRKTSDHSLDTEHMDALESRENASKKLFSKNEAEEISITAVKAYGSAVFDEMEKTSNLSHVGKRSLFASSTKANGIRHFRKLDLMWKLWMNEELALLDDDVPKKDKFKRGVANTIVESDLDFALELALKDAAWPMGLALTLLSISDKFYDKNAMKQRLETGESHLSEVRTRYISGDIIAGWMLERAAFDQIASARRMQAAHNISNLSDKAAKKLVACWDSTGEIEWSKPKKFINCFFSPQIKTLNEIQSQKSNASQRNGL